MLILTQKISNKKSSESFIFLSLEKFQQKFIKNKLKLINFPSKI